MTDKDRAATTTEHKQTNKQQTKPQNNTTDNRLTKKVIKQ
jgi:hypothetical protein